MGEKAKRRPAVRRRPEGGPLPVAGVLQVVAQQNSVSSVRLRLGVGCAPADGRDQVLQFKVDVFGMGDGFRDIGTKPLAEALSQPVKRDGEGVRGHREPSGRCRRVFRRAFAPDEWRECGEQRAGTTTTKLELSMITCGSRAFIVPSLSREPGVDGAAHAAQAAAPSTAQQISAKRFICILVADYADTGSRGILVTAAAQNAQH